MGVIGAGLISQAMHLPHLASLRDRFTVEVVADPSPTVRERVGDRFGVPCRVASPDEAIARDGLDAVVVSSPNGTHARVVLDALAAGLHVFVEKPICITLADADAIVDAQRAAERVVQVGYNNRFDRSYEKLVEELPESTSALRYISVVVHDPEHGPYFGVEDLIRGDDIAPALMKETRRDEARQVREAVGADDASAVRAFSEGYLGSLVHQVNLVHGMLERMGEPLPGVVVDGDTWADGQALTGAVRLSNGARWDSAWIQLLAVPEYEETISLFFEDTLCVLETPSPWLRQSPSTYSLSRGGDGGRITKSFASYEEAYQREMVHFHRCILGVEECRTPPSQARLDLAVLTSMYNAYAAAKRS